MLLNTTGMVDRIAALVCLDQQRAIEAGEVDRIRMYLSSRILSYHIPYLILIVDEIPKGSGGKISQEAARQRIAAEVEHDPGNRELRGTKFGDRKSISTS